MMKTIHKQMRKFVKSNAFRRLCQLIKQILCYTVATFALAAACSLWYVGEHTELGIDVSNMNWWWVIQQGLGEIVRFLPAFLLLYSVERLRKHLDVLAQWYNWTFLFATFFTLWSVAFGAFITDWTNLREAKIVEEYIPYNHGRAEALLEGYRVTGTYHGPIITPELPVWASGISLPEGFSFS